MCKIKNGIIILILLLLTGTLFAANYEVLYKCQNTASASNQIQPHFNIRNNSGSAAALSDLKIRYYYTKEGAAAEQYWCDYAVVGNRNLTPSFQNGYLEIGFSVNAGNIPAGGESGQIQIRVAKTDWSNYNQADDYSFAPSITSLTSHSKVTLYLNGNLVWGTPPGGTEPTATPTPTMTVTPTPTIILIPHGVVSVYPAEQTVVKGDTVKIEIRVNSVGRIVAAYGIDLTYSESILSVNTGTGTSGVEAGADGFVSAVNAATPGKIAITGFDVTGKGPGTDLHLNTVHFKTLESGTSSIQVTVNNFTDTDYNPIGILAVNNGTITVKPSTGTGTPTPTPTPTRTPTRTSTLTFYNPPDIKVQPGTQTILLGNPAQIQIRLGTGNQRVAAYGIDVVYDGTILAVNKSIGTSGVEAGAGGFVSAVNPNSSGTLVVSGFDPNGKGPGENLHLFTVHFNTIKAGTSTITPKVDTLTDLNYSTITLYSIISGTIIVESSTVTPTPTITLTRTPTPTKTVLGTGVINVQPASQTVILGDPAQIQIRLDSGNQKVAAYGIDITFDGSILAVNTSKGSNGVEAGADGFLSAASPVVSGKLVVSGFDPFGKGPGEDLHLFTAHFKTTKAGTSAITPAIMSLTDLEYNNITLRAVNGGTITVESTQTATPTPTPIQTRTPTSTPVISQVPVIVTDIYQAEKGTWNNAVVQTTYPGYTGTGYVNTANVKGVYIEWNVNVQAAVTARLSFYYTNGGYTRYAATLAVNGSIINSNLAFSRTGSWYTWLPVSLTVSLRAGVNTVRLTANSSGGLAYMDKLEVKYSITDPVITPTSTPALTRTVPPTSPTRTPTSTPTRTPTPSLTGDNFSVVFIVPASQSVNPGSQFATEVHVNTGGSKLAAYGLDFKYNSSVIGVNTGIGTDGVVAGANGFVSAVNSKVAGLLVVNGFDVSGKGPGSNMHLITLNWEALARGTSVIDIVINSFVDELYDTIGSQLSTGGTVTVH